LRQLAFVDGLTGLANRRLFNLTLESETRRARRTGTSLALILCDLDYFKRVNDNLGHQAGDEVLRVLGRVLVKACRRAGDRAARFGGEEFALILPGVSALAAPGIARQLCGEIAATPIRLSQSAAGTRVTASLGVSAVEREACEPSTLIGAADAALLTAKRSGRNCVRYLGWRDASLA
jgi:diguanylate cyclase (GGDEF)-like protein